jgi:protein ImuB
MKCCRFISSLRLVAEGWCIVIRRAEHAHHAPTELIDQYKARLGHEACNGITIHSDFRPELAWRPTPPNMASKGHRIQKEKIARRPIWLLKNPQPAPRHHFTLLRVERIDVGW